MRTVYHNGTIFTGREVLKNKAVLIDNGLVTDVISGAEVPADCRKIDLAGQWIAPALIDLQIYGGNGKLFSHEVTLDSLHATNAYCRNGGVAHFMITMATNSREKVSQGIRAVRDYWSEGGKGLLGLHLEGPFINPVKKGAHIEKFIRRPEMSEVALLLEEGKDVIKMITLAPECCDKAIILLFLDNGILVSAGHSNASYAEAYRAFDMGIKTATHLFNAMSPFQSRAPGMVGAIFDHPEVMSSLICDGIHIDFAALRVSKKVMGERLFFITDAVTTTTTGEYQHVFKEDHYTLPDGTLSGSALTMAGSIQNAVTHAGILPDEALRMASLYPAALLGNFNLGSIKKGSQACFVKFDESMQKFNLLEV